MRRVVSAALSVLLIPFTTLPAQADELQTESGVVVELFTSQGCAACPPADDFLSRLSDRNGVIALSFHVDYWDYIGWKDRFAKPEFTARQKAYAVADGRRSVYTPQMIVGGSKQMGRLRPMEVVDAIQSLSARPDPLDVEVERSGAMLEVVLAADPPLDRAVNVQLVRYRDSETVSIKAGENAGRTLTYRNIVTQWQSLGEWDGHGRVSFHIRVEGEEPVVILVQENGPGAIISAFVTR